MIFTYDEIDNIIDVDFDPTDECYNCYISDKCPLIKSFQCGVAHPASSPLDITYCELKV